MRLDWRRERFVWVPCGSAGTMQSLGLEAQALVAYAARLCDARGVIRCDPADPQRALMRLCGTHLHERRLFSTVLDHALRAGALTCDSEGLWVTDFELWQRTRDPRRRLYERERPDFARLPTFTRAFAAHMVRVCDDDGLVRCAGPQDWADTSTRAQYQRSFLDRRMAARVACHLDGLLAVGFLDRAPGGLTVRHHAEAQRPKAAREAAEQLAQRQHDGGTMAAQRQHDGGTMAAQRSVVTIGNSKTDVVPTSRSVASLPSDPPSVPPQVVVDVAPPPARDQGPAPGLTARAGVQGSLFPNEPTIEAPAKGRKRARVAAPTLDLALREEEPGFDAYALILENPMLAILVDKPGEFVRLSLRTYDRVDLRYEIAKAGEYLLGTTVRYSDGRAFLRRWLDRAQKDAARQTLVAEVLRGAAPTRPAVAKAVGAPAPVEPVSTVPVAVRPWKA